jgi:beta-lactamase regulating signal transducer with metallopeptidase domain
MANELVSVLAMTSLAISAGILLMLVLRRPLRKLLGATVVYQAWLLVPALMAVPLLPRPAVAHKTAVVTLVQSSAGAVATAAAPAASWNGVLALAWLCGALVLALFFWRAHATFVARLGRLAPRGELYISASGDAGPALLGLWRPKVVVPADFASRYSEQEQALIVAHEQVHARRGDVAVNLLQASLQCVFWFNPLVHLAALCFRADQEMACDAAVLRRHPGLVRTYAAALLKSQAFSTAVPLTVACSWRINHPVKERFMTLQQNQPGTRRRLFGRFLVASLILGTGWAGLAARADDAPGRKYYDVRINLQQSAVTTNVVADRISMAPNGRSPRIITEPGAKFSIAQDDGLKADFVLTPVSEADRTFKLTAEVSAAGETSHPTLIGRLGEQVGISVAGNGKRVDLTLVVNEISELPKPGQ